MNPYMENLRIHLAAQTLDYGYADISTLLEMLYNCYTTHNPVNSERIRNLLREQSDILSKLHYKEIDRIFAITNDVCIEHEHVAFLEGIRVGARLAMELTEMR